MVQAASSLKTKLREYESEEGAHRLRHFFRRQPGVVGGPAAAIVEHREPNCVLRPHFHLVPQYQVFIGGSGTMGKHKADPISFHYTDAYTPYGPIKGKEHGVVFMTIRAQPDATPAHYMPESRHELTQKAGRGLVCNVNMDPTDTLYLGEKSVVQGLLEPHEDGLAAYQLRAGPGAHTEGPDTGKGGGQYYVVVNGSASLAEEQLPLWSLVWVGSNEAPPRLTAGVSGLDALVLQFPRLKTNGA